MATYFFKLIPPRPTFRETMTPEERAIMNRHVAYWTARQKEGKVPAFGPVFDSSGSYGIAVVAVETEAEATDLRAAASARPSASSSREKNALMLAESIHSQAPPSRENLTGDAFVPYSGNS